MLAVAPRNVALEFPGYLLLSQLNDCLSIEHAQKRATQISASKAFLARYGKHEPGMDRCRLCDLPVRLDRPDAVL
jgi:hypothetical protein